MTTPSTNWGEITTTTLYNRSRKLADNVTKNNALLARLNQRGNVKTISGGNVIFEELSFDENANGGFYSGYDLLPVAAQDVISAAEYQIKQYAVPVVMSGLEMLQNSGKEQFIDLLEGLGFFTLGIGITSILTNNIAKNEYYGQQYNIVHRSILALRMKESFLLSLL